MENKGAAIEQSESKEKDNLKQDFGSAFGLEDGESIGLSKIFEEFKSTSRTIWKQGIGYVLFTAMIFHP